MVWGTGHGIVFMHPPSLILVINDFRLGKKNTIKKMYQKKKNLVTDDTEKIKWKQFLLTPNIILIF